MLCTSTDTARLHFRPLALGDEKIIFPHITDTLVEHWIGWERSTDIKGERVRVEKMVGCVRAGTEAHFLAFDKTNGFVGLCSITAETDNSEEKEIGIWVIQALQGRGYASEMLSMLVESVKQSGLTYLVYSVTEGNTASRALAQRFGQPFRTSTAIKRGHERSVTDYRISLL